MEMFRAESSVESVNRRIIVVFLLSWFLAVYMTNLRNDVIRNHKSRGGCEKSSEVR